MTNKNQMSSVPIMPSGYLESSLEEVRSELEKANLKIVELEKCIADNTDPHPLTGKKVILRAPESGVFIGRLVSKDSNGVTLRQCQRIWSWSGALETCDLAARGPSEAKVSPAALVAVIPDGREIFSMSKAARTKFKGIGVWNQQ